MNDSMLKPMLKPMVFMDGLDPDGNEMWIAWIDYMSQGRSEEEALDNFLKGWDATIALNADAGITPAQMIEARYPDTAGQLASANEQIDRLNARIETMDAERMEMIARTNAELDKLRDALAERESAITELRSSVLTDAAIDSLVKMLATGCDLNMEAYRVTDAVAEAIRESRGVR
jgi:chromosome segregation ATPase